MRWLYRNEWRNDLGFTTVPFRQISKAKTQAISQCGLLMKWLNIILVAYDFYLCYIALIASRCFICVASCFVVRHVLAHQDSVSAFFP